MTIKERLQGVREGKHFTRHGAYVFDRRLFRAALLVILLLAVSAVVESGVEDRLVYSCNEPVPCRNPFRTEEGFCTLTGEQAQYCDPAIIQAGEVIGEPPGLFRNYFLELSVFAVFAAFLLNHYFHNREAMRAWRE